MIAEYSQGFQKIWKGAGKKLLLVVLLCVSMNAFTQTNKKAFKDGEWLKFRISYSNFFNAGNATMQIKETQNNGQDAFHVVAHGKTTGVISWFFKVEDDYQSYFYKDNTKPYRFIRKINEGGHTKNKEIYFNHQAKKATVKDYKRNTEKTFDIQNDVQDMISTLYYLRNENISSMKMGEEISLTMFFDQTNYNFKLRYLGKEVIRTKFGKVATVKFMPIVQAGRVFKEEESLTVWVSDDENKIPLRIKASLTVGSMRADLDAYKGLANPFPIIF
tara:strand:+ start:238814 stop:239635 length:822 start_codon:yes stop_codon:yes gene_type:complete